MTEQNRVTPTQIGEILLGELPEWHVGVCRLVKYKAQNFEDTYIRVYGENDHRIGDVSCDVYRESVLGDGKVCDLQYIADEVNKAIEREHAEL